VNPPIIRARAYIAAADGAVSSQGGHDRTFAIACALVKGFDLSTNDALEIISEWNSKCVPPWTEQELAHKIESANSAADTKPRGYILRAREFTPKTQPQITHRSINPLRKPSAHTFDIELYKKQTIATAGATIFQSLQPWSVTELSEESPKPLPVTPDENFEAYLKIWNNTPESIWCGAKRSSGHPSNAVSFAPPSSWLMRGIPSADCLWTAGGTFPSGCFQRKKNSVTNWRFIIVESDRHSYNQQAAIIRYLLSLGLPISMVVDTMGSSLHCWIDRSNLSDQYVDRLQLLLCGIHDGLEPNPDKPGFMRRKFFGGMGCDPATFRCSQPARLPGATRPVEPNKRGGVQQIVFLA